MRTYVYGARAPTGNAALITEQLRAANRYRNALVDIERWRRSLTDGALAPLRAARDAATPVGEKRPKLTTIPDDVRAEIDTINDQTAVLAKAAYADSPAFWGTQLCVADGVGRAVEMRKKSMDEDALPHFARFDGSGTLAAQIQSTAPLESWDTDTRVRLVGTGKRRQLWMRIGSNGRAPVWGVWPVFIHREIEGQVRWVKMIARRVATKIEWSLHLSLDGAPGSQLPPPQPTLDTIAIDVGWRRFRERKGGDGLRVAAWVDSNGQLGELRLPERLLARWQKTADLGSIRDQNHNAALAQLLEVRRTEPAWPTWLLEATQHAHAWNKPARLAALVWRWRHERAKDASLAPWDTLMATLEAWRKQDKHLYEWEANQRENVLRARREVYRVFAKFAATYQRVVVEQLDLRDFAELPEEDETPDTPQQQRARPYRFKACISELLGALADAAGRSGSAWAEVEPAWTTQTCAMCGRREEFDAAAEVSHQCKQCGYVWDQDTNAARNLLRAAMSGIGLAVGRSRQKDATTTSESEVSKRRRAGKARKKAKAG